jgi:hypothetical protein
MGSSVRAVGFRDDLRGSTKYHQSSLRNAVLSDWNGHPKSAVYYSHVSESAFLSGVVLHLEFLVRATTEPMLIG